MEPIFRNLSGHGVMTMEVEEENHILEYQWRMLQDNPIDGLLPLSCMHREGRSLLSWRTTSLQPLALMFERRCWGITDLLHLVRQLFRILSSMDTLMLDPWRLLLDNRFILIEPVSLSLNFAYLPLSGMAESGNPVRELLQKWVMGECRLNNGGDSLVLSGLVSKLNDQDFQWRQLAGLCPIGEVLTSTAETGQVMPDVRQEMQPDAWRKPTEKQKPTIIPKPTIVPKPVIVPPFRQVTPLQMEQSDGVQGNPYANRLDVSLRIPAIRGEAQARRTADTDEKGASQRQKWHPGLIFLLLQAAACLVVIAAVTGSGVLTEQGVDGLSAWSGLVLVVGALEALAFSKRSDKPKDEEIQRNGSDTFAGKVERLHARTDMHDGSRIKPYHGLVENRAVTVRAAGGPSGQRMTGDPSEQRVTGDPSEQRAAGVLSEQQMGVSSSGQVGMMESMPATNQDRTELLYSSNGRYLLHRRDDGKMSRIEIFKLPFLLGRMRGYVDGCLEHPAVGKIHAELREGPDGLYVVDLNSRNGTRINGISLEPYHEAPIGKGDVLRIANEELVYECV